MGQYGYLIDGYHFETIESDAERLETCFDNAADDGNVPRALRIIRVAYRDGKRVARTLNGWVLRMRDDSFMQSHVEGPCSSIETGARRLGRTWLTALPDGPSGAVGGILSEV